MNELVHLECISESASNAIKGARDTSAEGSIGWSSDGYRVADLCMSDPKLELVWQRARAFKDNDEQLVFDGQLILACAIADAYDESVYPFKTEKQAIRWKKDFSTKANKVLTHLEAAPYNLDIMSELFTSLAETILSGRLGAPGSESSAAAAVQSINQQYLADDLSGEGVLKLLINAVEQSQYHALPGQRNHSSGPAARTTAFVRLLSRELRKATGQWKRDTVAQVTAYIFELDYYDASEATARTADVEAILDLPSLPISSKLEAVVRRLSGDSSS